MHDLKNSRHMSTDWNVLLTKNTINGYADIFFCIFFSGSQPFTTLKCRL